MTTTIGGILYKDGGLNLQLCNCCECSYIIYLRGNSIHTLGNPYSIPSVAAALAERNYW